MWSRCTVIKVEPVVSRWDKTCRRRVDKDRGDSVKLRIGEFPDDNFDIQKMTNLIENSVRFSTLTQCVLV